MILQAGSEMTESFSKFRSQNMIRWLLLTKQQGWNASEELILYKQNFKAFLGRSWKLYSRTIFMLSYMEDLIDPVGWMPWNENTFAFDTLNYREYKNFGIGSGTSSKVIWPGYSWLDSHIDANKYNFINGNIWLNSTMVPYYPDLVPNNI
ncbi:hypothetical protein ACFE04_000585 [Oxalis oulophora]